GRQGLELVTKARLGLRGPIEVPGPIEPRRIEGSGVHRVGAGHRQDARQHEEEPDLTAHARRRALVLRLGVPLRSRRAPRAGARKRGRDRSLSAFTQSVFRWRGRARCGDVALGALALEPPRASLESIAGKLGVGASPGVVGWRERDAVDRAGRYAELAARAPLDEHGV